MQGYLVIAGEIHALAIHPTSDGGYRLANGKPITLLPPDHETPARVQVGEAVHDVHIVKTGDRIWVHLGGRAHEILWRGAVDHHAGEPDGVREGVVRAPMPGAVVSVLVEAGDVVSHGAAIMVIESMKLETIIRAPRDGVVQRVNALAGESFERDAVLVEIGARD